MRRRRQEEKVALPRTLTTFEPHAWWGRDDVERQYEWLAARRAWAEANGLSQFPGDDALDLPDGKFYPEDI
jgi:hypothetical protein